MATSPIYFEGSWAILSTIGLINTINGLLVLGITGLSPVAAVPITVSAAAAVANGLCYYAFYASHGLINTVVAAAFADVFWLVCTRSSRLERVVESPADAQKDSRSGTVVLQLHDTQPSAQRTSSCDISLALLEHYDDDPNLAHCYPSLPRPRHSA